MQLIVVRLSRQQLPAASAFLTHARRAQLSSLTNYGIHSFLRLRVLSICRLSNHQQLGCTQHKPLDHTKPSIRLVSLRPHLSRDGLVQCDITRNTIRAPYTCLSYRWGAPEPSGVIRMNGKLFNVRQNLLDFLCMARQNEEAKTVYWIDALCIDQSNVSEKNHQVAQMGQIYSWAACVYIWLGARPELETASRIFKYPESATPRQWGVIVDDRAALEEYLCNNEYWERTWIIQEIFLARIVLVWLNTQVISFEYLHWSIDYFYLSWKRFPIARFKLSTKTTMNTRKMISVFREAKRLYHGASLPALLANFHDMKCEVPRDRVFSLLSMCAKTPIEVDYHGTKVDACARVLEQYGDMPCLCCLGLIARSIGFENGICDVDTRFGSGRLVLKIQLPQIRLVRSRENEVHGLWDFVDSRHPKWLPQFCNAIAELLGFIIDYGVRKSAWASRDHGLSYVVPASLAKTHNAMFDMTNGCWCTDDFFVRNTSTGSTVRILFSALLKMIQASLASCPYLKIGEETTHRPATNITMRVEIGPKLSEYPTIWNT